MPLFAALLLCLIAAAPATAQTGANVLLLVNTAAPGSEEIAGRYVALRGVPTDNVLRLKTSVEDELERAAFEREIELPVAAWITRRAAFDRILYIVLTKGFPLRVRGTAGLTGTVASVDSELTLMYRKLMNVKINPAGRVANPYFQGDGPSAPVPFSHAAYDIYLVTRLDGFTQADVMQLMERGAKPSREGSVVLDERASLLGERSGDTWLESAAKELAAKGFAGDKVVLNNTTEVVTGRKQVLGYYSWGSNDPAITRRRFDLGFVPGALAAMYVSTDGRTFREPAETWTVGSWSNAAGFHAGSAQSLAGDLIREGATGVAGHVAEPYLDATIRPQILFPAYVSGLNLAESFYRAMPYLSWQTVIVGDPLCAPFRSKPLPDDEATPALDPDTELPKFYSERRVKMFNAGLDPAAGKLIMKAEARMARGDNAGAREPLEQATAIDGKILAAQLLLAGMYEETKEWDLAIARYWTILATTPNEIASLNNLAYALAERKRQPAEALPFAQKAYELSKHDANIADTLGWVYFRLGNNAEAEKYLLEARQGAPKLGEVRVHLSELYAATSRRDEAVSELKQALQLTPSLESRDEVIRLKKTLNMP